jgi:hypothetical protein
MGENLQQKLIEVLEKRYNCKYRKVWEGANAFLFEKRLSIYPMKMLDGRELGMMIGGSVHANLELIYFESTRSVKWPDDWIDPYPSPIDVVHFEEDTMELRAWGGVNLRFMAEMYYAVYISLLHPLVFERRQDLMKLARFVPAVVKDFCVHSKITNEVLAKYSVDRSEAWTDKTRLGWHMKFSTAGMSDDEIIESVLKREEVLSELKRRWEEWLPSDERRECYESTIVCPEDYPARYRVYGGHSGIRRPGLYEGMPSLRKYPLESGNPELDGKVEQGLKLCLWDGSKEYNLDGYRLRLAVKTERGVELLGKPDRKGWITLKKEGSIFEAEAKKERDEILSRKDLIIVVDKRMKRLPKIPLEKMQFLREEFPEMFATDSEE